MSGGGTHVGRGGYALWSDSSGAHVNQVTVPSHSQYDRYNETRNPAFLHIFGRCTTGCV